MLPKTIEGAIDQPKVRELILAIGENNVLTQIEFELINLNMLMSVGGKLTDQMVLFIARNLIEMYPYESIADFKLCFERGAMGQYGGVQRLDGITIKAWMDLYLDSKYEVLEKLHKKQSKSTDQEVLTDNEKINGYLEQMKKNFAEAKIREVPKLTDKQIQEEGMMRWKAIKSPQTKADEVRRHELHNQWIRENFETNTGQKKPGWQSEDDWLSSKYIL